MHYFEQLTVVTNLYTINPKSEIKLLSSFVLNDKSSLYCRQESKSQLNNSTIMHRAMYLKALKFNTDKIAFFEDGKCTWGTLVMMMWMLSFVVILRVSKDTTEWQEFWSLKKENNNIATIFKNHDPETQLFHHGIKRYIGKIRLAMISTKIILKAMSVFLLSSAINIVFT